jgi:RNA polymerase sigma factor (sigma-70 family)
MATVAPEVPVLARDEAFEQLYRQYVKDVYHYALALLRNPADAEDVTQTTFLNAYRAFKRGEEILKPQNWLIKIAHNVARSRYARSSRRVKEVPLEDHIEQLALPDEERPNVEGVLRALGRLPFNQRAALVMRELEGRSYAEIGDTLGVSVAAVETLIFRARRSLRVRASALRSISAVPLPASLAQMFGGGGVVAGGIGGIGTGFVVKAAVALVAGTLTTGIGSDVAKRAVAAAEPDGAAPAKTVKHSASANSRAPASAAAKRLVRQHPAVRANGAGALSTGQASVNPAASASAAPGSASQQASPSPTAAVTTATQTTTETATSAVESVEETVTTAVPALPVQVPPLPSLPVQPPPLPKLP